MRPAPGIGHSGPCPCPPGLLLSPGPAVEPLSDGHTPSPDLSLTLASLFCYPSPYSLGSLWVAEVWGASGRLGHWVGATGGRRVLSPRGSELVTAVAAG